MTLPGTKTTAFKNSTIDIVLYKFESFLYLLFFNGFVRFIEWMDCCCGGGGGRGYIKVKEERGEHHFPPLCRDVHFQHPIRTMACEALAHFPSSMPLYSGESIGTQVLIPVTDGLIELFVSKHIPKDQKIIEFVMAKCNVSLQPEALDVQSHTNVSLDEHPLDQLPDEYLHNWPPPLHYISSIPKLQFLPPGNPTWYRS
ncbi:hypothetical protein L1049_005841 [Liquidambar formosana]|uniref:Uncharacterized protein n=1 Tax=Liquidambar formosana TaxID=63359 RepID=A0AAP0WTC9_LIQFO